MRAALGRASRRGPYWSAGEQRLYWVDILAPSVNRFDPATGNNEEITLPRLVSAVLSAAAAGWWR